MTLCGGFALVLQRRGLRALTWGRLQSRSESIQQGSEAHLCISSSYLLGSGTPSVCAPYFFFFLSLSGTKIVHNREIQRRGFGLSHLIIVQEGWEVNPSGLLCDSHLVSLIIVIPSL